jgi:ankyrin repeat protein
MEVSLPKFTFSQQSALSPSPSWFLPKTQIQKLFWSFIEIGDLEALLSLFSHPLIEINGKMLDDWTAIHLATNEGKAAILTALIKNGGDVNALTKYNKNPLHIACIRGNLEICKILIFAGCKLNSMDCYYKTPLQYAEEGGWEDVIQYLRNSGATRLGTQGSINKIDIPIQDYNSVKCIFLKILTHLI